MKDRKGMDPDGRSSREEHGEIQREDIIIRVYYMRKSKKIAIKEKKEK